jgi:hypothetical protein
MKIKNYAEGGVVEGPPHEQGGVAAVDPSGQQIAEVEGNERIFSVEDTQQIEQMALAIGQLPAAEADVAARELGYSIVDMVKGQDVAQAQQEQEIASSAPQGQQVPQEQPYQEEIDPALAGLT